MEVSEELAYLAGQMKQANVWISMSVLVALAVWETMGPYFAFFQREKQERAVHAFRNFAMGAFNGVMVSLVFSAAWMAAAALSMEHAFGLFHRLDLGVTGHLVAAVLLMDFWTYWWHRINHEVRFFWRFHKVHHSDEFMDVTTAYRFHLGEIGFSSLIRIAIVYLFGLHLWELVAYEVVMFICVQFHHANIGLPEPIDRAIRVVFVTPAMHKVHHSRDPKELNTNYTSLFSLWDRLFGTFRLRADPTEIHFGVDGLDAQEFQTIPGMMTTPLEKRDIGPGCRE